MRGVASGEGCSPRREGVASSEGVVLGERVTSSEGCGPRREGVASSEGCSPR